MARCSRDARFHVAFEPVEFGHEMQVLVGREVFPQREFLRHVAEPAPDGFGVLDHGEAEHFGVPVAGQQHAAEHAQRGGLAGAVRPEETVDAPGGDVEVDVVHRDLVAEFSRELPRGDRSAVHGDVHGDARSSVTSTGTPEGSEAASESSITTSARKDRRERSAAVSE